ncbi:hypothetical protein ASG43_12135 [Aureimonas sp. Leaf454]|uniref:FAD-dependent oxidoreductase n=1 Tax=Aureimonas sp. Leaf454 TaxID=1736381 RepID=UPI000701FB56|nr:NAD(P)/FAD-dependent oxidoreductase [Aureimonas sp. Leaf454]KQT46362.1 hypothetical protein ASG43_12135 [Aureimonas sp. Leaf454]
MKIPSHADGDRRPSSADPLCGPENVRSLSPPNEVTGSDPPSIEITTPARFAALERQWQGLVSRTDRSDAALEPNLVASAAAGDARRPIHVLLAWRRLPADDGQDLLGAWALRASRASSLLPLRLLTSPVHDRAATGWPVIETGFLVPVLCAMLDAMCRAPSLPHLLEVAGLESSGPLAEALLRCFVAGARPFVRWDDTADGAGECHRGTAGIGTGRTGRLVAALSGSRAGLRWLNAAMTLGLLTKRPVRPAMRRVAPRAADGGERPASVFGSTPASTPGGGVDVLIVGAGFAGSTLAACLGRSDLDVAIVDPHEAYPTDFRCEKLDPQQFEILQRLGLDGAVAASVTHCRTLWVARYGRLLDRLQVSQRGIAYHDLVNAVRRARPPRVAFHRAQAVSITQAADHRVVRLSNGEVIEARLVVLASGLNGRLRQSLGIERIVVSPEHSTTIGFDVHRSDGGDFAFDSLTYYSEKPLDRTAYLTLFRIGGRMRANLMTYRSLGDPWLQALRTAPEDVLARLMPGLAAVTGRISITALTRPRPVDLIVAGDVRQDGVVLIGDAFATSCPAAGTGTRKVLTDVEQLCSVHIPAWFVSDGMGADKIASFYEDPVKQAVDRQSLAAANALRDLSMDRGFNGRRRRLLRFAWRSVTGHLRPASTPP